MLDAQTKPKVNVAGSDEVRSRNVRYALRLPWVGRLAPQPRRSEPVAVVAYGPSLRESIEEIRGYRSILSCSGAHRILLDAGITPTWHHEIETREHKASMLGVPNAAVQYILASDASPALYHHLRGFPVALVHVLNPSFLETCRSIPRNADIIRSCGSVGGNSIALAHFLGFHDLHVFGMDGSLGPAKETHAGPHPKATKEPPEECIYGGRTFLTTPGLLYQAQSILRMRGLLPGTVKLTFHGDGLLQHMAPTWPVEEFEFKLMFFRREKLISESDRQIWLASGPVLNAATPAYATHVTALRTLFAAESVLDYGCGAGELAHLLPFPVWEYDPCVPGKSADPREADLVCALNVLECVEPAYLDRVLAHLNKRTKKAALVEIRTTSAGYTLSDGQDMHRTVQPAEWWASKLGPYFEIRKTWNRTRDYKVLLAPRSDVVTRWETANTT